LFITIFHNLEDRDHIFEDGSYFFNSVGLYLRFWMEHFKFQQEKEDLSYAPVWIRLYSLPQELWLGEIMAWIGNTLSSYVKTT
jgi:hypothetical protein